MTGCLCVLLLSGVMAGAETTASEEDSTSSEWLDRARKYAEKAKADDPWAIWLDFTEPRADMPKQNLSSSVH